MGHRWNKIVARVLVGTMLTVEVLSPVAWAMDYESIQTVTGQTEVTQASTASLRITGQPKDYVGVSGGKATFTVTAEGTGLTYKWEYSKDGGKSWVKSACTTKTASCQIKAGTDGWIYRCTVTDSTGKSVVSDTAKVILKQETTETLRITGQPKDYVGESGGKATFTVTAEGTGLTYKWEYSKDGGKSWVKSACTTKTASCQIKAGTDGWIYRCTVTDSTGKSVVSDTAKVILKQETTETLRITGQPKDYVGESGGKATFTVTAEGTGLTYKWEYSKDGGKSWVKSACTTKTASCQIKAETDGWIYRCTVTDSTGKSVVSDTAKVILKVPLTITAQPSNFTGVVGINALFQLEASGKDLVYQWQTSKNEGTSWENLDAGEAALRVEITESNQKDLYRCLVSDAFGEQVISNTVWVSLDRDIQISKQPESAFAPVGESVSFFVEASGPELVYQWQYYDETTREWKLADSTEDSITVAVTPDVEDRQYRCRITDRYGRSLVSQVATLTVETPLVITKQPENFSGGLGSEASFQVAASGKGLTYQWQTSKNAGITWENLDATEDTLVLSITAENRDDSFRCVIRDQFGKQVETVIVSFQVAAIVISQQPESLNGLVGESAYFRVEAEGDNLTYLWQFSMDGGESWQNSSVKSKAYVTTLTQGHDGRLIRCLITDASGWNTYTDTAEITIADTIPSGFFQRNGMIFYRQEDGTLAKGGWKTIDGKRYYFNTYGDAKVGLQTIGGKKYYFDSSTGAAQVGLITVPGGDTYYFLEQGDVQKGISWVDEELYYFGESSGKALTGWGTKDNKRYYFDPETKKAVTGFVEVNGGTYYCGEDRAAYTNGFYQIGENIYYFHTYGLMEKKSVRVDGILYFFNPETGAMIQGFYRNPSDGLIYYYDGLNGVYTGLKQIDGKTYYFYSNGAMARGLTTIAGKQYYFDWDTGVQKTGLVNIGMGQLICYRKDGGFQIGLQQINGKTYYFNPKTGIAKSGFVEDETGTRYFDPETYEMITGLQTIDGYVYYFNDQGLMQTGFQTVDGKDYYLAEDGRMKTGVFLLGDVLYRALSDGSLYTGFQKEETATYYYDGVNGRITGLKTIDGKLYYFSSSGAMSTGVQMVGNKKYYFSIETGAAEFGLICVNGSLYYFEKDGSVLKGLQDIGGNLYYFSDTDGTALTGWQTIHGQRYFFNPKTDQALTGWQEISGVRYYFGEDGVLYTGGIREIDGKKYYFYSGGTMGRGIILVDNVKCYFDSNTGEQRFGFVTSGTNVYYATESGFVTGLQTIDGALYYFNQNGVMQRGYTVLTNENGATVRYYFDTVTGKAITGLLKNGNAMYYFDGANGVKSGLVTVDGVRRYFNTNGTAHSGIKVIDGTYYYFDSTGAQQTGFVTYNSALYYFLPNGNFYKGDAEVARIQQLIAQAADGFQNIEGVMYFIRNGVCLTGFQTLSGKTYYFDTNGAMLTGLRHIGGKYYYFNSDGVMQTGAVALGRGTVYFDSDGTMLSGRVEDNCYTDAGEAVQGLIYSNGTPEYFDNLETMDDGFYQVAGSTYYFRNHTALTGLQEIEGSQYYFGTNGVMQTGAVKVDNTNMYFDPETGARELGFVQTGDSTCYYAESGYLTGVQEIDGKKYYFSPYGVMYTGLLRVDSTTAYYLDEEDGSMQTGWLKVSGQTYYADPDTGVLASGLTTIDEQTYCFRSGSNVMQTGWVVLDGNVTAYFDANGVRKLGFVTVGAYTYYLDETGRLTGLQEIDGKEYYFGASGGMYTGRYEIDGKIYYFDPSTGQRIIGMVGNQGYYYYYKEDGTLGKGMQTLADGRVYYFKESTGAAVFGLMSFAEGELYYIDEQNGMLKNTQITLEGVTYQADENGVLSVANANSDLAKMIQVGLDCLGATYGEGEGQLVCSTFVSKALAAVGIDLTGAANIQYSLLRDSGTYPITFDRKELKAGDVIFWADAKCEDGDACTCINEIHHVGIYIGGGKVMEATNLGRDEQGELYGYTLVRDLSETESLNLVMAVHVLDKQA